MSDSSSTPTADAVSNLIAAVEDVRRVNSEAMAMLKRVTKQNAAMREALQYHHNECKTCHPGKDCPEGYCICSCDKCHAESLRRASLQPDAGACYLSPEQVRPLVAALTRINEISVIDDDMDQAVIWAGEALEHARTLGLVDTPSQQP